MTSLSSSTHPALLIEGQRPVRLFLLPIRLLIGLVEVLAVLKSFFPGSSGGVDGLCPQHVIDMTEWSSPGSLEGALVDFVNMVLAGGVPFGHSFNIF